MDIKKIKFDIVIQGGQSNAEGCGVGPVDSKLMPEWSDNIFYLEAGKSVECLTSGMKITYSDEPFVIIPARERGDVENPVGDFSLSFGELYEKKVLEDNRKLLIVRAAIGGTGFVKKQWGLNNLLHLKMLEMADYALSLNKENRVVGFLWHQGECDAFEKNNPNVFERQLTDMIQDVRNRYSNTLPFIAGDFVSEWKEKNISDCAPIVTKIRELTKELENAAFVETADLLSNNQKTSNGDDIHFCRESLYILGRRYYEAFEKLIKSK